MSAWHEVLLDGSDAAARAFVAGFAAGHGEPESRVVFGDDVDLEPASLGARLRDLLHAGTHLVAFAPADVAAALATGLVRHGATVGLRLGGRRAVVSARFEFTVETYNREQARSARQAFLESVPPGVAIEDLVENEEAHPEAHGVELYAPLHQYAYRATGKVTGTLPGVLEVRRRSAAIECVELGSLHVEADTSPIA